jgi:hypothetical protein
MRIYGEANRPPAKTVEQMIPLDLIRRRLKIDDYAGVSDVELELLRAAAVEEFENFTGRIVGPPRQIAEPIRTPRWSSLPQAARARIMVGLRHPTIDGVITLEYSTRTFSVRAAPGDTLFEWPASFVQPSDIWPYLFNLAGVISDCGGNCSNPANVPPPMVYYFTGGDDLLPGAIVGMLKYIAWQYEHPGDSITTVNDRNARITQRGETGSNNALITSGAYEEWMKYKARIAR